MLIYLFPLLAALSIELKSPSAILMNADTGAVLFEKNAHEKRDPSSTSKIATCIYALSKNPDLNKQITGNQECTGITSEKERLKRGYTLPAWRLEKAACHMGIKVGEVLTLRDLFLGMMVASAGDASNLIAEETSSTIPNFMSEMNSYLKKNGCYETTLQNPHGLYHPDHKSTAYDLAVMTRIGLKNPLFCSFVASKDFMRPKTNKQEATKYLQTNRLLRAGKHFYPAAIGVKTGYQSQCGGYCLVSAAEKGGRRLIAVVLGAPDSASRYQDSIDMFEAAFNEKPVKKEVIKPGVVSTPVPHLNGKKAFLKTTASLAYETFPSEDEKMTLSFEWLPKTDEGKYILRDSHGTIKGELFATVDRWAEEDANSFSLAWLSLLTIPIGYCFLKRS